MSEPNERETGDAVGVSQLEAVVSCRDMIRNYLESNGYDGLAGDECGCSLYDLMPCNDW